MTPIITMIFGSSSLTETGIATYLQVLITWLVFVIGIPVVIFQTFIEPDVREVAKDRLGITIVMLTIAGTLVASILLVWMLKGQSSTSLQLMEDRPRIDSKQIAARDQPTGSPAEYRFREFASYAVPFVVTITMIVPFLAAIIMMIRLSRTGVVRRLENDLGRSFEKRGCLKRASLERLIYLGAHGKPGDQKEMVLDVLGQVAKRVQREKQYQGYELEDLISGIGMVVCNEFHTGSDENFWKAAQVLKAIMSRHFRQLSPSQLDASRGIAIFRRLGVIATEYKSEPTALIYLEDAATYDISLIYEIGLSALHKERFLIATAALNKLESLHIEAAKSKQSAAKGATLGPPFFEDVSANLLGLLAHFMILGVSTRKRAEVYLNSSRDSFLPNLSVSLEFAFAYHFSRGAYETSDNLAALTAQSDRSV